MNDSNHNPFDIYGPPHEGLPDPGERVIKFYEGENGEVVGPIISTPVHIDGSHIRNGKSIYRPLLAWWPAPIFKKQAVAK